MPPSRKRVTRTSDGLTPRQLVTADLERVTGMHAYWKFGHSSFATDLGTVFCFVTSKGHLAMKLPVDRVADLVEGGTAQPLSMDRRSMREWVVVPDPESPGTLSLLRASRAYVESLAVRITARRSTPRKSAAKKSAASRKAR